MSQTCKDWEVVIVDDGSTDDSVEIISRLIGDDRRFVLYKNEINRGCGYTKNRCAQLAKGEICGFLDPDDALLPEAIDVMIKEHLASPATCLVHSSFYYCDKDLNIERPFSGAREVVTDKYFTNFNGPVTHFATFKLSFYNRTEGIDTNLLRAVDQDLYLKLSEVGTFKFLNKVLYRYRIHDSGISINKGFRPFYYHLKSLIKAEERRNVNLENQIQEKWEDLILKSVRANNYFDPRNLENPRYLVGKTYSLFFRNPLLFFKKLFLK